MYLGGFAEILIFLTVFLIDGQATSGVYDIQELREVSYDFKISDDSLWFYPEIDFEHINDENINQYEKKILDKLPKEDDPQYVFIVNSESLEYVCKIPDASSVKTKTVPKSSRNPSVYASALSASFYVNKCIHMKSNGWWRYEFCRGQMIDQIHGEKKEAGYVKNNLGLFDGSFKMPDYQTSSVDRLLYVEESYSGGTMCDLENNQKPRKTLVRYECDSSLATHEAYIRSINEIKPCEYIFVVKVGSLCSFSEFLIPSQKNRLSIGCYPEMKPVQIRALLKKYAHETMLKQQKERVKREVKHEYESVSRRYAALKRTYLFSMPEDFNSIKNVKMEWKAARYHDMVATLTTGSQLLPRARNETVWRLWNLVDPPSYLYYENYNTLEDENKGNLWYYFNDPKWPKKQYPKDLWYSIISNSYFEDVRTMKLGEKPEITLQSAVKMLEIIQHMKMYSMNNVSHNYHFKRGAIMQDLQTKLFRRTKNEGLRFEHRLSGLFNREDRKVHQIVIDRFFSGKNNDSSMKEWPLGGYLSELLHDHFEDISSLMIKFLQDERKYLDNDYYPLGDQWFKTEWTNPKTKKKSFGISYEYDIGHHITMERHFLEMLAPYYFLISTEFLRTRAPVYVKPDDYQFLWEPEDEFFKFHWYLGEELVEASRFLAAATIFRFREVVSTKKIQIGDETAAMVEIRKNAFLKEYPAINMALATHRIDKSMEIRGAKREMYRGKQVEEYSGEGAVRWLKIKIKYIFEYVKNDYKHRRETKERNELLNLLAEDPVDITKKMNNEDVVGQKSTLESEIEEIEAQVERMQKYVDFKEEDEEFYEWFHKELRMYYTERSIGDSYDSSSTIEIQDFLKTTMNDVKGTMIIDANGEEISVEKISELLKNLLPEVAEEYKDGYVYETDDDNTD